MFKLTEFRIDFDKYFLELAIKEKVMNFEAIFWDFDGTLIDTRSKNFNVTKKIIASIENYSPPFELTQENYQKVARRSSNWRELYLKEFGLDEQQTDKAGKLWTQFQLKDNTLITIFPGLSSFLKETSHIPQGIISQNSRENIIKLLKANNIDQYFDSIIGYEEVDLLHQKPHPEGILKCANELGISNGTIIYIGDHETDINTAVNAGVEFKKKEINIDIVTIAAYYGDEDNPKYWQTKPDLVAGKVDDLFEFLK
jgi:N-acetyl-D-muramate 6-phosphate phosphatase